jgi:diguanylate cyclase (GGDEF)-like protein
LQLAEVEAARRANELSALHQATTILLSTLDLSTLLGQILDAATNAIPGAEKGMLHLIAPDTGQLEMRATIGYSDARIQKFTFPGSKSYVARTVQGKKPLLINDVQTEPLGRLGMVHPEARTIRSAIAAPLITADKILGALSLESSKRSAFDGSDLHLLKSFAATATLAIQNAQLHAEVQKLAITDSLTGLYNRRGFDSFGNREVERLHRFGRPLSALMVDVDDFKDVNDHYGHHVGDQVIREVGKRISRNLREVDIIGRFGGDEFCILLPEADLVTARGVAERLRSEIEEQPIEIDGVPIFITISVGVARALPNAENLDNILGKADKALYTAKQHGRNRVEIGAG